MATVYLAQDVKHDRQVAVKVLRPELAAVIGAERFLQEIRVTAHLQHPHILPLFDSGAADSFLFYVMPYLEGESLRDRLNREKELSIDEAIEITRAVASALDYAHRHKVIHRDVKPENILLHDGQPVVADFGIALAVSVAGGSRLTETGVSLGTPQYMSPEQASGDRQVDARSDVYSLACVVYEMLAGEPPHTGPTVQAIIAKVLTDQPQRLQTLRNTVPPHVEAAVQKAPQKLPADRFATAAQFGEALTRAWSPGVPVEAAASPTVRLPWTSSRRQWPLRRAVTVVSLLLTAMAGFSVGRHWPSPGRSPARGMKHTLTVNHVTFSPDGRLLVSAGEDATIGVWNVSSQKSIATLIGHTRAVSASAFSPDGKMIASASVDRTVRIWDAATGRQVRVLSEHRRAVQTVAFTADGRFLASGGDDGKVFVWDIATGSVVKKLTGHTNAVASVAFSADGSSLASASDDETVRVWDVATGRATKTLRGHSDAVTDVAFIPKRAWLASSSWDQSVKLWDLGSGTEVRSMAGHTGPVNSVAASPDGEMLVSGGEDGTVRVWKVATGRELHKIVTDGGAVTAVDWSRTGLLAWGSHDGTVNTGRAPIRP